MKRILNLVNSGKSEISYKVSNFPDGQQQVTIISYNDGGKLDKKARFLSKYEIEIKARLNNFRDLELIICAVASLKELGIKHVELYVPYFLGSRSDRKFEEGSNNYLKTVICPIINNLGFTKVTVLDPHSDVLEACLNNFNKIDNYKLINFSLFNINNGIYPGMLNKPEYLNNLILISPDAGANKKIFKLAEQIGYTGNIITCSKSRDVDGKLTKTEVPFKIEEGIEDDNTKDIIIIDDICDGGRTFINIAKEIKRYEELGFGKVKIYLIVTHGIFSKGFEELNKYFDGIYCTNSYSDIPDYYNNGIQKFKTNVKQLNVF